MDGLLNGPTGQMGPLGQSQSNESGPERQTNYKEMQNYAKGT